MFTGVIGPNKELSAIERIGSDSRVVGSVNWIRNTEQTMKFRFDQFGERCILFLSINVPFLTYGIVATADE